MSQKSIEKRLICTVAPVETLLLICEKCGKKKVVDDHENPSLSLKKRLKARLKEMPQPKAQRAITTSCLGICPEDAITIGFIDSAQSDATIHFYILQEKNLEKATDILFQQFFLKKLEAKSIVS